MLSVPLHFLSQEPQHLLAPLSVLGAGLSHQSEVETLLEAKDGLLVPAAFFILVANVGNGHHLGLISDSLGLKFAPASLLDQLNELGPLGDVLFGEMELVGDGGLRLV